MDFVVDGLSLKQVIMGEIFGYLEEIQQLTPLHWKDALNFLHAASPILSLHALVWNLLLYAFYQAVSVLMHNLSNLKYIDLHTKLLHIYIYVLVLVFCATHQCYTEL